MAPYTQRPPLFGSLGVLLLLVISSLLGSWARDAARQGTPRDHLQARGAVRPCCRATSRGFTMIASGDVLAHGPVLRQARGPWSPSPSSPMTSGRCSPTRPPHRLPGRPGRVPSGGAAVTQRPGHLQPGRRSTPPQLAAAALGHDYDACSTASNHSMDQGPQGVAATWRSWTRPGFAVPAWPVTPTKPVPTIVKVRGLRWAAQLR